MLKYSIVLPEQVGDIYERVSAYLPDSLKNINAFAQLFLQKDSMFLEVGDYKGVFWFTKIIPGWMADAHVVLWDESVRGLSHEAKRIILEMKRFLRLRRVSAYIPDLPEFLPAQKYAEKIGFRYEGLLRYADQYDGQLVNIHAWAITEEV